MYTTISIPHHYVVLTTRKIKGCLLKPRALTFLHEEIYTCTLYLKGYSLSSYVRSLLCQL